MTAGSNVRLSNLADFHGWRIGGKALHVGELPGRKQVCLYVLDGATIRTLAFFATEEKATEAMEMLDKIANSTGVIA
jgi:hypothetical protein